MGKFLPLVFLVLLAGCTDENAERCAQAYPHDASQYQACMDVCFKLKDTSDFRRCERDKQNARDEADAAATTAVIAASVATMPVITSQ